MEPWIPILVAALSIVGGIFTALLSGRGEAGALRTLKLMGEVLEKYPSDDPGRADLEIARSALATKIANKYQATRARTLQHGMYAGLGLLLFGLALLIVSGLLFGGPGFAENLTGPAAQRAWWVAAAVCGGIYVVIGSVLVGAALVAQIVDVSKPKSPKLRDPAPSPATRAVVEPKNAIRRRRLRPHEPRA